jgi:hypothetical protein
LKTYPLKIEELADEGDAMSLFSRGHHDDEAFKTALIQQYRYTDGSYPDGPIYRAWWRFIPPNDERTEGYYSDARPASRGAFPVTVVDL